MAREDERIESRLLGGAEDVLMSTGWLTDVKAEADEKATLGREGG